MINPDGTKESVTRRKRHKPDCRDKTVESYKSSGLAYRSMFSHGMTAFSICSVGIGLMTLVCVNGIASTLSINSVFSLLSLNSAFSILSMNSAFAINCVSESFKIC